MEIIVAKTAGFCFGVNRAVDMVHQNIDKHKKIYTYGPIIHNKNVVLEFEKRGVEVINEDDDLSSYEPAPVIIRSHGVTKKQQDNLSDAGFDVIDATCPFVKKIHRIVAEHAANDEYIIVVGNCDHPEVKGIVGWIGDKNFSVISSAEDAYKLGMVDNNKICIVSQTTFNYNKFQEIVEIVKQKGYDVFIVNTICNATFDRQKEAKEISSKVDVMLVIGDEKSSNTQKLFEICKSECNDTYFVQTVDDLDLSVLQAVETVGITAGASTPNTIIEEVQKKCQILNKC